jgi:hypothetical protein
MNYVQLTEQELNTLIQAIEIAQSKGVYNLQDSATLFNIIQVIKGRNQIPESPNQEPINAD